ncbi:hypothetical protein ACHAXH_001895, partial [Discostella pseudostelligera]
MIAGRNRNVGRGRGGNRMTNHRHHHHAPQARPRGVSSRNGSSGGLPYMPSFSSPTPTTTTAAAASVPPNYRTEMCRNITMYGFCRYRGNCHYAHSEEERVVIHVNGADDILMWPCPILLMTGYCPYDYKCKHLHDPQLIASDSSDDIVILQHCTKGEDNMVIPDRLF